jgi:hypothetical protein
MPTGDKYEALGTGAVGIEPFVAGTVIISHRAATHLNIGYEWNGESILAGDVVFGTKRHIPSRVPYAVGADIAIKRRLTVVADIIGFESIHGARLRSTGGLYWQSFNVTDGSTGLKVELSRNLFANGQCALQIKRWWLTE